MTDNKANVALLRDAYHSFNDEGVRAFERVLAPEVELLERPRDVRHRRRDREDTLARLEELGWQTWRIEPLEFEVFDDRVLVPVAETVPAPDGGAPTERTRIHYWKLGPEGASRLEVFRKRAAAVNAAVGYFALLERLHERLRPRTYVEIGVHMGRSLGRVPPGTVSIGIDPEPKVVDTAVEEAARIFKVTSDDFFRDYDLRSELGGMPVDFAFIDGMHLFEFALRDFMNVERHAAPTTVIVFDDVFPNHPDQGKRARTTRVWTGDVWKLAECLAQRRPDLLLLPIDCSPTGLLVVIGADRANRVLWEDYNPIVRKYAMEDVVPPQAVLLR
ncbi:MAG TPA: class I SAM-dependent methyltransferase, partial [Solirubrobacterales bacterium]|nr:class I SAM-dependent methyltransferase [Solirubrobacterales bacterium]